MTTERARRLGDEGFTLIEVVFAFLILSIGLLGVQSLAAGSANMVRRAERQGDYMTRAESAMEGAMREIRRTGTCTCVVPVSTDIPGGKMLVTGTSAAAGASSLWTITVVVTPSASNTTKGVSLRQRDAFTLRGNVYR